MKIYIPAVHSPYYTIQSINAAATYVLTVTGSMQCNLMTTSQKIRLSGDAGSTWVDGSTGETSGQSSCFHSAANCVGIQNNAGGAVSIHIVGYST